MFFFDMLFVNKYNFNLKIFIYFKKKINEII